MARYGSGETFPAFYSRESLCKASYQVQSTLEAAKLLQAVFDLQVNSGIVLAVPVPQESEIDCN